MKTTWADEPETLTECPPCGGRGSTRLAPEVEGFYRFKICATCRGKGRVTASEAVAWRLTNSFARD